MPGPALSAAGRPAPLLAGGAAGAVAAFGGLVAWAPEAAPFAVPGLAAAVVAVVAAPAVRDWEVGGLVAVLALSFSALGSSDGVSVLQVVFGVALLGYVVAWYAAALVGGRRVIRGWTDVAAAAFFVLAGAGGLLVALASGTSGVDLRSDLTCVLALALFFPVREVCVRAGRGPETIAASLLVIGLAATVVSALRVYNALTGATELYEIVDVRVSMGEVQIIAGLLVGLLAMTVVRGRAARAGLGLAVAALLGGLLLAKSRGPWITAVLGLVVAGALAPPVSRRRLVPYAVGGAAAAVAAGVAVLGNQLVLVGVGLLRRFLSISSALTQDVSLINRYAETADAMRAVWQSPVVGHGWGATVLRFDLTVLVSLRAGFLHNGYVWFLHKVGVVGLACFLGLYLGALGSGALAARTAGAPDHHRALAAAGVGVLVAFAVLALPSNPFAVLDQMIVVTLVLGLVSGLRERHRPAAPPAVPATAPPVARPAP